MQTCDAIASFLSSRNVTTAFGIIGGANARLYNSFIKYGITIYNVHNEQAAVHAAGAYWRVTGNMAVVTVTSGGGVTNTITGITSLWADSIPTILLTGQEGSEFVKSYSDRRMYGIQGFDVVQMVSKITKYSKILLDVENLEDDLNTAWNCALEGRPGPVLLDIPSDIQSKIITKDITYKRQVKSIERVKSNVGEQLKAATRPVILAGHGIILSGAVHLFRDMLNKISIPVLVSWSAIDVIGHDNPLFCGSPGIYGQRAANFIMKKADFILVLGSRLAIPQTGYDFSDFSRCSKIVQVDIDSTEFRDFVHEHILADCGEFIKSLSDVKITKTEWVAECQNLRKEFPLIEEAHDDEEFLNSYKVINKIQNFLKPDHIIVTDMGTALTSTHQSIHLKEGQMMFTSCGLGEMGFGLPSAFGAAIAAPERDVLCINGDGAMMMNLQELQTIVQNKLKIKIIIFNNKVYKYK